MLCWERKGPWGGLRELGKGKGREGRGGEGKGGEPPQSSKKERKKGHSGIWVGEGSRARMSNNVVYRSVPSGYHPTLPYGRLNECTLPTFISSHFSTCSVDQRPLAKFAEPGWLGSPPWPFRAIKTRLKSALQKRQPVSSRERTGIIAASPISSPFGFGKVYDCGRVHRSDVRRVRRAQGKRRGSTAGNAKDGLGERRRSKRRAAGGGQQRMGAA